MIDAASKAFFHSLARIDLVRRLASRYGMRPGAFARRFIAGETVEEAIAAVERGPLPESIFDDLRQIWAGFGK